jgi:hypothetical protein
MLLFIPLNIPLDTNGTDLWKTIVITLFILSMINERITNFIKLNIDSILSRLLGSPQNYKKLFNNRTNFSIPEKDKGCEKKRERGILNFAVICGFFVAAVCGADLLFLVQTGTLLSISNPAKFWDIREISGVVFRHGIGFILTAFFISLGSKFWHDLLDVLLYTSNLKRKLVEQDPIVFSSDTADEVKESAELTDRQLVNMAQKQFVASLPGQVLPANVVYIGQGRKIINGRLQTVVIFYLRDANRTAIPEQIKTTLGSARLVNVPTYVVVNVDKIPQVHFDPGLSVKNGRGSICCLLSRIGDGDSLYALTCSHVLTNGSLINKHGDLSAPLQTVKICKTINGQWAYGLRTEEFDIALVKTSTSRVNSQYDFIDGLNPLPATTGLHGRKVVLHSQKSGPGPGFVLSDSESTEIQYSDGSPTLYNLLEIGSTTDAQTCSSLTTGGDSGALLYDPDTKEPIGMVIGGNSRFTYAIPLSSILQNDLVDYQIFTNSPA